MLSPNIGPSSGSGITGYEAPADAQNWGLIANNETRSLTLNGSMALVFILINDVGGSTTSAVKWGGSGGTNFTKEFDQATTESLRQQIWSLDSPNPGTYDLYIEVQSGSNIDGVHVYVYDLDGVDATTPIDASGFDSQTVGNDPHSVTPNATATVENSVVFYLFGARESGVPVWGSPTNVDGEETPIDGGDEHSLMAYALTTSTGAYSSNCEFSEMGGGDAAEMCGLAAVLTPA